MTLLRILAAAAMLFASACAGGEEGGVAPEEAPVVIETASGPARFVVEIADEPEEMSRGLMFRRELADDAGMLFVYEQPRRASMWMKNTYIPLDIIYIRTDGTIARIAEMAEPHSLDTIPSGEIVAAALEIRGGRAGELGIEPGDLVRHPLIDRN
ncbi:MAG: DUF192 domain-containing protein [Pseudomonadota bacterium]